MHVLIQMLKIMASSFLRDLACRIKSSVFHSIMADETTDASNHEQIVIVIRHVSDDSVPQEEFTGLAKVLSIDANTLTESLLRMNLSPAKKTAVGSAMMVRAI